MLRRTATRLRRLVPFLGPAFIASVAYVDPGNFATNIQAGSSFGYALLWVVVGSNVMALGLQALSAKLGIATRHNLAELCRLHFPKPLVLGMWGLMELVAMATDLAEVLGAAVGFQLLFHIPLLWGGVLTAVITGVMLETQRRGHRPLEIVITGLLAVVAGCYLLETLLEEPDWGAVALGAVIPRFEGTESVVLAAGILGATVMPHAIFLHSALTQHRLRLPGPDGDRRLYRYELADVGIAMTIAGLVNAAMLVMAASTFHRSGLTEIGTLEEAYRTLEPLLGRLAEGAFGLSLLVAGLSSSVVGTLAGQTLMQGFLERRIPIWVRRVATLLPALVVIALGFDPTRSLVISQVVLSFGLPFAVIPLILFTRRRDVMGDLVNHRWTTALAVVAAVLILALNAYLLIELLWGGG